VAGLPARSIRKLLVSIKRDIGIEEIHKHINYVEVKDAAHHGEVSDLGGTELTKGNISQDNN
jgi:hypothetical protein